MIRPASWARAQATAAVVVASPWSAGLPGGHWEAPVPHWLNSSDRTPLVLASRSASGQKPHSPVGPAWCTKTAVVGPVPTTAA